MVAAGLGVGVLPLEAIAPQMAHLPLTAVPEDKGGVGGTLADLMAVLRLAGENAVPVPLAETALANVAGKEDDRSTNAE